MSAGHLSREFRAAYGESPYSYLMTRRIERAMALLRRGDLSVTEVCFAVGCSSLGTFSTRFTELVGVPPSAYRREGAPATAGMPPCVAKQVDPTGQESRSTARRAATSVTAWTSPFTRASCRTTTRTPRWPSTATSSASRSASTSATGGMRWITVGPPGPARHVDRAGPAGRRPRHHRGRAPHDRRDDGQGHLRLDPAGHQRPRRHLRAARRPATPRSSRSRPSSRTASATARSATPRATWSASRSSHEDDDVPPARRRLRPRAPRRDRRRGDQGAGQAPARGGRGRRHHPRAGAGRA